MGNRETDAAERSAWQGEPTTDTPEQTGGLTFETESCNDVFDTQPASGDLESPAKHFPKIRFWYAIQTFSGKEASVCNHFSRNGLSVYLPSYRPRYENRDVKLIPGYVLSQLSIPADLAIVNLTPHALAVLGAGKTPFPIPDAEVLWLRQAAALRSAAPSGPVEGDLVRVVRGPMAASNPPPEGRVIRDHGALRLVVEISILGRGVSVEIDRRDVEVIKPVKRGNQ